MPRRQRLVIPGFMHHVVQRGNYRQKVFEDIEDFQRYSWWTMEYAVEYGVDIIAYCLMPNHVHFIVIPFSEDGLARMFRSLHMRYSQYKHAQEGKKGHLWQSRFYSCVLDKAHMFRAIRYVERNPVRAKLVDQPWQYVWSSAREHMEKAIDPIIKTTHSKEIRDLFVPGMDWKSYIQEEDEYTVEKIRSKTQRGSVVGEESFIQMLEVKTGRVLQERKAGRPKEK